MLRLRQLTTIFFVLTIVVQDNAIASRQCDPTDLSIPGSYPCSETEVCDNSTRSCQCLAGFERLNSTYCVKASTSQTSPNYSSLVDNKGNGSIVAGILIPVCLIILVICGIYVNRKYQVLTWVRNKINRRSENYDEFMIGQDVDDDDPPLRC